MYRLFTLPLLILAWAFWLVSYPFVFIVGYLDSTGFEDFLAFGLPELNEVWVAGFPAFYHAWRRGKR